MDARNLSDYYKDATYQELFKTVISNCALEHINMIEEVLKSIGVVLKESGYLIFTVPSDNLNNWVPSSAEKLERFNKRQQNINIYSFDKWEELLDKHGFEVENHWYLFNEREYKKVMFLDALLELLPRPIGILHYLLMKFLPNSVFRLNWRYLLK